MARWIPGCKTDGSPIQKRVPDCRDFMFMRLTPEEADTLSEYVGHVTEVVEWVNDLANDERVDSLPSLDWLFSNEPASEKWWSELSDEAKATYLDTLYATIVPRYTIRDVVDYRDIYGVSILSLPFLMASGMIKRDVTFVPHDRLFICEYPNDS